MAVGLNEAFWLFEEYGNKALELDDRLSMAAFKRKKGCRLIPSTLTDQEKAEAIKIGEKIKRWKEANR